MADAEGVYLRQFLLAPFVEAFEDGEADTASTSYTLNIPSSRGDYLVAHIGGDQNDRVLTWPAGWLDVGTSIRGGAVLETRVKKYAGESSIVITSDTNSEAVWRVTRIRGAIDPAIQMPDFGAATGNSTSADPPKVRATSPGNFLSLAGYGADGGARFAIGFPVGYINTGGDSTGAGGTSCHGAWANKQITGKFVEDPTTFTIDTAEQWAAVTVLIPAAPTVQRIPTGKAAAAGPSQITATEAIIFGESANIVGTGLIEATEAVVFGESVNIVGRGAIEATGALTFGESADIGPSSGLIEATEGVTFGESANILGRGVIEATEPVVFGESANLIDANAGVSLITATEAVVFGESANILGRGLVEGTEPVVFGELAVLINTTRPITATEPLTFAESVDILGRGLVEATEPLTFSESVNITGVGLVEGSAAVAFAESANLTPVFTVTLAILQQQVKDLEALMFADIIQP